MARDPDHGGVRRLGGFAAALMLTFALGACGDDADTADDTKIADQASDLIGNTFVSTSVEGYELAPNTAIQLMFTNDALTVSAGCNTMSAAWSEEGEVIAWTGPAASTMMGCSPELMEQDQWLDEIFTEGLNITSGDADLTLLGDGYTIELELQ